MLGKWAIPLIAFLVLLLVPVGDQNAFAVTIFGPSFYLDFDNSLGAAPDISPFSSIDFSSGYFHLEDFEDGLLNTPGLSEITGTQFILSGPNSGVTDSVDGDDGVINNFSDPAGSAFNISGEFLIYDFSEVTLGNLPTYAGIVITDYVSGGPGSVDIQFLDKDNNPVLIDTYVSPNGDNDGTAFNGGPEDLFYGVNAIQGISRILVNSNPSGIIEVDHIQYGFIPTEILVGGTPLLIDTTALLVAGFNANSLWMIPAVLGIAGAGIVIYKLKRK